MNDTLVFEQDYCCISDNLKTSHDVNIVPEQSSTSFNTVIPPVLCILLLWYFRGVTTLHCSFMLLLLFVVLTELRVAAFEHSSLAAVTHNQGRTEVEMCLFVPWNVTKLRKTYFFLPLFCPLCVPLEALRKEYSFVFKVLKWVIIEQSAVEKAGFVVLTFQLVTKISLENQEKQKEIGFITSPLLFWLQLYNGARLLG